MMKKVFLFAIMCGVLAGCGNKRAGTTAVDYRAASGYFVLNTVDAGATITENITSQQRFSELFGEGHTMASGFAPIDFTKEFAVGVILPSTDRSTELGVDSLTLKDGKLALHYSVVSGAAQSFTIRPCMVLVIDRQYDGTLEATAHKTDTDYIPLAIVNGTGSATYTKAVEERVAFGFEATAGTKLHGVLTSDDAQANVRFSQIIMPDGSADGPWAREIEYALTQSGTYKLIVTGNMMAGDPWAGTFTITVKLAGE